MLELVAEKDKTFVTTIITFLDACTLLIACTVYMYIKPDEAMVNKYSFYIGTVACLLYLLIIPESPRWLFVKYGSNSQEAIKVLNYIAKFNGSNKIIPQSAIFDIVGQMV
jgi:hypothetical protein